MPLSTESKYPTRRTYVLKLRGDATADALAGRVENLVTGNQQEFTSASELLHSIASDLMRGSASRADDDAAACRVHGDQSPTQR